MNLPVQQIRLGKCEVCGFRGIVWLKAVVPAIRSFEEEQAEFHSTTIPTLLVCPTCYETPAGAVSENVTHERLPEAEYLIK